MVDLSHDLTQFRRSPQEKCSQLIKINATAVEYDEIQQGVVSMDTAQCLVSVAWRLAQAIKRVRTGGEAKGFKMPRQHFIAALLRERGALTVEPDAPVWYEAASAASATEELYNVLVCARWLVAHEMRLLMKSSEVCDGCACEFDYELASEILAFCETWLSEADSPAQGGNTTDICTNQDIRNTTDILTEVRSQITLQAMRMVDGMNAMSRESDRS